MARRGTSVVKPAKVEAEVEIESQPSLTASDQEQARTKSIDGRSTEGDDRSSVTSLTTTTIERSSEESASSGTERVSARPSREELVHDTAKLQEESVRLQISLVEEKLALAEKRIAEIDKGTDEELGEKLSEIKRAEERKMDVAKERLRLERTVISEEYSASIDQIHAEIKNVHGEMMWAQDARHRIKADHHASQHPDERTHAGHEFCFHVEHQLRKDQIAEDLSRIKQASVNPISPAVQTPLGDASKRKYSLRDDCSREDVMVDGTASNMSAEMEGNAYRLSKIRRKSR